MKRHILNIAVFITVTAVTALILLFAKRPAVSETERRDLTAFPEFSFASLKSGEYAKQIGLYFSDSVPGRDILTAAASRFKNIMGVRTDDVKLHNVVISPETPNTADTPQTTAATAKPPEPVQISDIPDTSDISDISSETAETADVTDAAAWDGVIDEVTQPDINAVADITNNGVLVYGNTALMLYGGNKKSGERYAGVINAYRDRLPVNVNVFDLVNPTSVEFYCPADYRRLNGDQRENINHIYANLKAGVIPVNAYSALAAHTGEDIFLRTDHHWAALGAYYAAEEFCKTAGVPFADISEYERVVIPGYVGTMYGYSGDSRILNNPEDFVYYKPQNDYETTYYNYDDPETPIKSWLFVKQPVSMSYCVFMGGDSKITRINTDVKNGRRLAVFKDSFGNALVPFLTNSFEEIIVIDIRYFPFKAVDYLTDNNITDVLFANNIFAANTDSLIDYIENIM